VGITFGRLAFSYWIDNLGFLLREKLDAIFIKPCSWGFPTDQSFTSSTTRQQVLWHYSSPRHHPSLWERRARNRGLVILKGKKVESYKTNNNKTRRRRIKNWTYRR
jgi:hypothetical protein